MKLSALCTTLCMSFCATLLLTNQLAFAQSTTTPTTKTVVKKKVAPVTEDGIPNDDEASQDVSGSSTFEYRCELNDFLTIYTNTDDNDHLALRWRNRLFRLTRVETTTGANRFENKKVGLVWIGIPTKGMLLDSRHGKQLANECKTAGQ